MNQYKVLVVEDDPDLTEGLAHRIRLLGYDVVQAMDGYQAVSVALKEKPNVVLLDIGLPGEGGLTVLTRYASLPTLMFTPVVVLSGRDPFTTEAAVREFRVIAFLRKPASNNDLEAALHAATRGEPLGANSGADPNQFEEVALSTPPWPPADKEIP